MMPHAELRALFQVHYGHGPEVIGMAPARVNLIGEHTDYNDGFVFPVAIDRFLYVASRRADAKTRLYSQATRGGETFDAQSIVPGVLHGWARYPAGVAWALRRFGRSVGNLEAFVVSDIPVGSGVSSSAALELAFAATWNFYGHLGLPHDTLAHVGKLAENEFVGVNCGIMDQMACASSREGLAMFLDTRTLDIVYAPIPASIAIVLCDTKKPRSLSGSAYNERRIQCETAAHVLGVPKLRDADMPLLEAAKPRMDATVYRRARHVITENARCVEFRVALDEVNLPEVGRLMRASHDSLRDDYEVSCAELDAMADAAQRAPGCIGARMTGAGFGGACVALVERDAISDFSRDCQSRYKAATGIDGEILACRSVDGASVLSIG